MTAGDGAAGRTWELGGANVVLIGPRGSGKSSVGRMLAERLGWPLADTDREIELAVGAAVREIFAQRGESGFRALERDAIARLAHVRSHVISVGGGAVLKPDNRRALRAAGVVVWLTATPEELLRRIEADAASAATRPALTAYSGLDEIRHLLAAREPLYAEIATLRVATGGRSVAEVVETVLASLAALGPAPGTHG